MITFITVVYNDIDGLKRTVNSLINQSSPDWRLIIKDGGSQDGSAEYALDLQKVDCRVNSVVSSDKGIYDAMNLAILLVNTEYLLFLNAGDEVDSTNSLSDLNTYISSLGASKPDVIFMDTLMCYQGGKSYIRKARDVEYISYGQPAIHQSTLYKSNLHKKYLYDLTYKVSSDYASLLKMFVCEREAVFVCYHIVFSKFEIIERSTSFRKQSLSRIEMARAQREIANYGIHKIYLNNSRRYLMNFLSRMFFYYSLIWDTKVRR